MAEEPLSKTKDETTPDPERREFLRRTAGLVIGGAVIATPALAGLRVIMSPLIRKADGSGVEVRLASLDDLKEGDEPRLFKISAERKDAFTRYAKKDLGSVFLQRTGPQEVRALSSMCPHAGCSVSFDAGLGKFNCPCHKSLFTEEGSISGASPAARGLDALPVDLRSDGSVWVTFMIFRRGIAEKIPV